jgi:hypothetical protein
MLAMLAMLANSADIRADKSRKESARQAQFGLREELLRERQMTTAELAALVQRIDAEPEICSRASSNEAGSMLGVKAREESASSASGLPGAGRPIWPCATTWP